MINKAIRRLRGFTLIETLVAVLLLVSAVAGPLTIASKGLTAAITARDQMIAFYLAQDGVEYVRYVRDSNKLGGSSWLNGLTACTGAIGCTIDPSTGAVAACTGACGPIKKRDDGAGHKYFTYSSSDPQTPQNFVRTIKLSTPPTGETTEAVLTVTVSWRQQSGITRSISVRENILDWQ